MESSESLRVERAFNPLSTAPQKPLKKKPFLFLKVIGSLVFGIGITYLFYAYREEPTPKNKSIAILPFKNLSEDQQNEYFSEGIIEAIQRNLSQIGELRVISRTSVE